MYSPRYFQWFELMPSEEYKPYWLILMDERILRTLDHIRMHYGKPVTVNNWHQGGTFTLRGFRPMNSTTGAKYSQHKFGRAADFDVQGIGPEQVRKDIRSGLFPLITCVEDNINWVHIDVRNTSRLLEVHPK